jgi:hypothetical protein
MAMTEKSEWADLHVRCDPELYGRLPKPARSSLRSTNAEIEFLVATGILQNGGCNAVI